MRLRILLLVVTVALLAGCAGTPSESLVPANMPELKAALGVLPQHEPPLAKAQANATLASVGQPIRFTSEGSSDPQGLPITYLWSFGDGATAAGPSAEHAYTLAGEHVARLTVTNDAGLADHDVVTVQVSSANRAPVALLRVLDASGAPLSAAKAGERITFDASGSRDPEGQPLAFDLDLGDGTTSHDARASHAYAEPGRYVARLIVRDAAGAASTTEVIVPIGGTLTKQGTLAVTDARAAVDLATQKGLAALDAVLRFDGSLGANDLTLVVLDAEGNELGRAAGPTPPGAQGELARRVTLDAATLARAAPGDWTFVIEKTTGAPTGVAWALDVVLGY